MSDTTTTRARTIEGALFVALVCVAAALRFAVTGAGVFAGADSYGYVALAEELWRHGRYALGPDQPPHVGRMPLYALFVAIVKRDLPAVEAGGAGWTAIRQAQAWLDLLTLPVLYVAVRRAGGPAAALLALALVALCPFVVLCNAAALSESVATSLTTLTVAALLLARDRPRLGFAAAGASAAACTLTRPDGILLLPAFVPAVFALPRPRERWTAAAVAAAGFLLVYAPWPTRNVAVAGRPYFLGARVDMGTRPLARYHGWWRWIRSWSADEWPQTHPSTCFYNRSCAVEADRLPATAFDSPAERAEVEALLRRHAAEGNSPAVDAAFEAMGARRERRSLWRAQVALPARRAYHMWVSDFGELLQNRARLPALVRAAAPHFRRLLAVFTAAIVAATIVLAASPRRRWLGLTLATAIGVRTLVLAHAGYSMPRYAVPVMPIACALIALAAVEVAAGRRRLTGRAADRSVSSA